MNKKLLFFTFAFLLGCRVPVPQPPSPPSPTPPPTTDPTPLPIVACVPMTQFGNGGDDALVVSNLGSIRVDTTPKVHDREYCAKIGFAPSVVCPMGPECHPTPGDDCSRSQRARCEAESGPYIWTFQEIGKQIHECGPDWTDDICFLNNNPLQIKIKKPTLGGAVCILSERTGEAACATVFPAP